MFWLFFSSTPCTRRQFLLEYYSWRSKALSTWISFSFNDSESSFNSAVVFSFVSGQLRIPQIFSYELNGLTDVFQLPSAFNLGVFDRGRKSVTFVFVFFKPSLRILAHRGDSIPSVNVSLSSFVSLLNYKYKLLSLSLSLSFSLSLSLSLSLWLFFSFPRCLICRLNLFF